MKTTLALAALSLFGAAVAVAPASAASTPAEAEADSAKAEKQQCRRVSAAGSRLGRRICMTKAEWTEMERRDREAAERVIDDEDGRGNRYAPGDVGGVNPNNPG